MKGYRPRVTVKIPPDVPASEHVGIADIADEINKRLAPIVFDGRGGKRNATDRAAFAIFATRCGACLIAGAERT